MKRFKSDNKSVVVWGAGSKGVTFLNVLDAQEEMTFLRNIGDGLDVSVSVMGMNRGFTGQGDLFVVESSVPLTPEDLEEIPFTLLVPGCKATFMEHKRCVVHIARKSAESITQGWL